MTDENSFPARSTLAWAVFVGCSWTWCIGLFLPVLMVRDFGLAGWVVFAAPNVLGAGAVGFARYRREGIDPVAVNRRAMGWFSVVTIAFHIFFNLWFVPQLLGGAGVAIFVLAAGGFYWLGKGRPSRDLASAGVALAVSAAAAVVFVMQGTGLPAAAVGCPDPAGLALLAPSVVLGFVLCPHLDLTFHRARTSLPGRQSRRVFALGFGGIFLALIAFSLFYAPALMGVLGGGGDGVRLIVLKAIGAHMAVQSGLTVALHLREIDAPGLRDMKPAGVAAGLVAAGIGAAALAWKGTAAGHISAGELAYRGFMAIYGLAFPAYAWAAWRCRGRGRGRPPRWVAWVPSVVVGMPLLSWGFLTGWFAAVPVAVLLVLVNPLVVPAGARGLNNSDGDKRSG